MVKLMPLLFLIKVGSNVLLIAMESAICEKQMIEVILSVVCNFHHESHRNIRFTWWVVPWNRKEICFPSLTAALKLTFHPYVKYTTASNLQRGCSHITLHYILHNF